MTLSKWYAMMLWLIHQSTVTLGLTWSLRVWALLQTHYATKLSHFTSYFNQCCQSDTQTIPKVPEEGQRGKSLDGSLHNARTRGKRQEFGCDDGAFLGIAQNLELASVQIET
jgi:hypothetical protein